MPLHSTDGDGVRFVVYSPAKTELMMCSLPIFWNKKDGWGILSHATVYNGSDGGFPKHELPTAGKWLQLTESFPEVEHA